MFSGHDPHLPVGAGRRADLPRNKSDSRLLLLREGNSHLSLFQPLDQIRRSRAMIFPSQLVSCSFSFSLFHIPNGFSQAWKKSCYKALPSAL